MTDWANFGGGGDASGAKVRLGQVPCVCVCVVVVDCFYYSQSQKPDGDWANFGAFEVTSLCVYIHATVAHTSL